VFRGELQTIHDLLYRSQVEADEETLESILANLAICLQSLVEINASRPEASGESMVLDAGLRSIARLANEICGECVPRLYAPAVKESLDQIQALAWRLG
jgi:hypothetical protein